MRAIRVGVRKRNMGHEDRGCAEIEKNRMMMRWMCGVSLRDKVRSEELLHRLGVDGVTDIVRRGRLRWFGHVERKSEDDWVSACRELVVDGAKGRGRGKKTWMECIREDMRKFGLSKEDEQDRVG